MSEAYHDIAKRATKNVSYEIVTHVLSYILVFSVRTVFIKRLGVTYLGINGVLTNIISILSLTEMGFNTALAISLYKPLVNKDFSMIKTLVLFFRKIYAAIMIFILVIGISLIPFLRLIIQTQTDVNIEIAFLLYLTSSIVTYFSASYSTLLLADQKGYILSEIKLIKTVLLSIIQLVGLFIFNSFYVFLFCIIIANSVEAVIMHYMYKKTYRFSFDGELPQIESGIKKEIYRNTRASMLHKFGGIILTSTDNIVISAFVSVEMAGYYANYTLIIGVMNTVLNLISNSLAAFVGEIGARNNKESLTKAYWIIHFFISISTMSASVFLFAIVNKLIIFWIGEGYVLTDTFVIILILQFYINGIRRTAQMVNMSLGLYDRYQFFPIVESICNIALSIALVKLIGIIGVIFGTIVSVLSTTFWKERRVLHTVINWNKKDNIIDIELFLITVVLSYLINKILMCCYFYNPFLDLVFSASVMGVVLFVTVMLVCLTNSYGRWWLMYIKNGFQQKLFD